MADRSFLPHGGALEVQVVDLFCDASIGAAGAPSPTAGTALGYGKGISTFVRNSAGRYTITLSDSYNKLLLVEHKLIAATFDPSTSTAGSYIVSEQVSNTAAPKFVIQFYKGSDGSALDPASGSRFMFLIKLRNSSVT